VKHQHLALITGAPSIGKTVTGERLLERVENSAFLDGDWLWHVNPFLLSDSRLRNGDKSMSFALSTYLKSRFDVVIFSSVILIDQEIRSNILKDIDSEGYVVQSFHLKCSTTTLLQRHRGQRGTTEPGYEWLQIQPLPNDVVIDTDNRSVEEVSGMILEIVQAD
jgi:adenylylsulfate kinase-like enzyme